MGNGILDKLSSLAGSLGINLSKVKSAIPKVVTPGKSKSFSFQAIPRTLAEMQALPEAALTDVYATAALVVLALSRYESDKYAGIEMLNFLKGPDNMSNAELQHINDRLMDGKSYKLRAFFEGATPANNYTPSVPYTVKVSSTPYSFDNENWAALYVHSAGSDSPRPMRLRKKPSTGQWFLVEIQHLGDVRTPVAADKWA